MAINYRPANVYGNRVIAGMNYPGYGGQPVTVNYGYVPAAPAYPLQNNLYYGPGVPVAQRWYGTDPNASTVYAGYGVQQGGQQVSTLPPQQPARITQTAKRQVAQQPSQQVIQQSASQPSNQLPEPYVVSPLPYNQLPQNPQFVEPLPHTSQPSNQLPEPYVVSPLPYNNIPNYSAVDSYYQSLLPAVIPETEEEYNARMSKAALQRNANQFANDMSPQNTSAVQRNINQFADSMLPDTSNAVVEYDAPIVRAVLNRLTEDESTQAALDVANDFAANSPVTVIVREPSQRAMGESGKSLGQEIAEDINNNYNNLLPSQRAGTQEAEMWDRRIKMNADIREVEEFVKDFTLRNGRGPTRDEIMRLYPIWKSEKRQ